MPWCPKCRNEYREGFESCSDCGGALVEELPEETALDKAGEDEADTPVFLVSAADNFEADIMEAKLEAYGVPVLKKHRETGGYLQVYMGASPFGLDLYVPSKLLDKAREILEPVPETETEEYEPESPQEQEELEEEYENRKERSRNWLFLLFGIPALIYLLISLLQRL